LRDNAGQTSLEASYMAHKDRLLTLATAFLGDRNAAEDVLHDVFASLLADKRHAWNGTGIAAYLTTCVRNRAIDALRKRARPFTLSSDAVGLQNMPEHASDDLQKDEAHLLLQSVSALPDDLRETLSLRIWGDLNFEDIAKLQSVSKSTAHDRYRQALEKLRFGIHGEFQR
jgi:RNA polymerase sigma-70 factor (ECF subfamily)